MYTSNVEALKKALKTRGDVLYNTMAEVNKLSLEVGAITAELEKYLSKAELAELTTAIYLK